jgi:hypothetical protein
VALVPRLTAAERHLATSPADVAVKGSESGSALLDALTAFHHPTRRWICELLSADGPASVGRLSGATGLAAGSVSHHLGVLHRYGFVEPAPELARDSRESWWRIRARDLTWDAVDFADGTVARRVAATAEAENFRHHVRAVQEWLVEGQHVDEEVRRAAVATDTFVPATLDQMRELSQRLTDMIVEWSAACRADALQRPHLDRVPVRASARVFPSRPVGR